MLSNQEKILKNQELILKNQSKATEQLSSKVEESKNIRFIRTSTSINEIKETILIESIFSTKVIENEAK